MKTKLPLLALTALCLSLSGCVYRSYDHSTGKYTSLSIATKQGVGEFDLEKGKKDDPSWIKFGSKGLTNTPESSIVEAAVSAAVKAAK